MYAKHEATKQRRQVYREALDREKAGYEARLEAKRAGVHGVGLDLSEAQIEDRIKQVDAELARTRSR